MSDSYKAGSSAPVGNEVRPPPPPPELPKMTAVPEALSTPNPEHAAIINSLITELNYRLKNEICTQTTEIAKNVADIVERRRRTNAALRGNPGDDTPCGKNITDACNHPPPSTKHHLISQDVRICDAQRIAQTSGITSTQTKVATTPSNSHCAHPVTPTDGTPYPDASHRRAYAQSAAVPLPPEATQGLYYNNDGDKHEFNINTVNSSYPKNQKEDPAHINDDPNMVLARDESDQIGQFLDASDAPQYQNTSDSELKHKKQAAKAIASAFQKSQFGGDVEEDWDQHKSDYQAIVLDYHLRSKELV